MSISALEKAVEVAGGQKPLATLIGTTQSQVWYWLSRSKKGVSAQFVLSIEAATGVPRHELRPDIYPAPQAAPGAGDGQQAAPAQPVEAAE